MINVSLKNTLLFSLAGHILIFSLFALSFGKASLKLNYGSLIFWGDILPHTDLVFQSIGKRTHIGGAVEERMPPGERRAAVIEYNIKPFMRFSSLSAAKPVILQDPPPAFAMPVRKDAQLIFHPLLPYQLQLYFRDRQAVHIELMFNIISGKGNKAIAVKRKISSGNLEADLLCLRYISHYLFIQQARFSLNHWQTVKIDLSK
jgi:hypothetical protein